MFLAPIYFVNQPFTKLNNQLRQNYPVNCDQAAAHGHQQAPGTDILPGTRRKHTRGGQLDGSIWLLGIRSTGLLIQIALLNGCERLLKYRPVLVSLVGIRAKSVSLFMSPSY